MCMLIDEHVVFQLGHELKAELNRAIDLGCAGRREESPYQEESPSPPPSPTLNARSSHSLAQKTPIIYHDALPPRHATPNSKNIQNVKPPSSTPQTPGQRQFIPASAEELRQLDVRGLTSVGQEAWRIFLRHNIDHTADTDNSWKIPAFIARCSREEVHIAPPPRWDDKYAVTWYVVIKGLRVGVFAGWKGPDGALGAVKGYPPGCSHKFIFEHAFWFHDKSRDGALDAWERMANQRGLIVPLINLDGMDSNGDRVPLHDASRGGR